MSYSGQNFLNKVDSVDLKFNSLKYLKSLILIKGILVLGQDNLRGFFLKITSKILIFNGFFSGGKI